MLIRAGKILATNNKQTFHYLNSKLRGQLPTKKQLNLYKGATKPCHGPFKKPSQKISGQALTRVGVFFPELLLRSKMREVTRKGV